ncbi:hypothetical protein Tco_0712927 [Tanacetum coccineum]
MVDSSSHKPSSPKITPKEEHVTLDKPESSNPFLPVDQVEFIFEEITITTNNKVALLYPSHPNLDYFREVSDFISKCLLKEAFIRSPTQYKEYLSEFWNALRAYYLPHSSMYVSTPSITIVRPWFATIGRKIGGLDQISNKDATILYCLANGVKVDYARLIWEDIIHKLSKKTKEKVVPYPRFISLILEYMMPEYDNEELTINPTQDICNLDVPVDSKAPKPSSQTEEVTQGKKPGAKSGLKSKQSSKHTSECKIEASKSKTGQSEKETQSSSAKDKSPIHPSPPTPVVGEIHKEAQQAAGGPTSLGATSEDGAHPQLRHDALADSTTEADPELCTNEESKADEISKKIKLEDLSDLLKDTRSTFFTPDSPQDEPISVSDESEEEEEVAKDKDTHASSHDVPKDTLIPHPPSLISAQIQELMAQVQLLQS